MSFIEFLDSISGANSPLKSLSTYSLNDNYTNKTFQDILVSFFGKDGTTVADICDNSVLGYGERALYLKLAIFASPHDCSKFLDYIYAAIVDKRPGHYWSLLLAIKQINDQCNNSLVKTRAQKNGSDNVLCNDLLLNNSGTDFIPAVRIGRAIRSLIKSHIELIGALGRARIGTETYLSEHINLCNDLQKYTPNPLWRLRSLDVTETQIKEQANQELNLAYEQHINESLARLQANMYEHTRNCGNPLCFLRIMHKFQENEEKRASDYQIKMMKEDQKRYEIESVEIMTNKLTLR